MTSQNIVIVMEEHWNKTSVLKAGRYAAEALYRGLCHICMSLHYFRVRDEIARP